MMISSKIDQPTHCAALSAVGTYEPRRPSGARSSTIAGTRASAPISPATPSIAFPIRLPTTIASTASGSESARHEVRARDEHEQRDAEVAPEESVSSEPEHAQPLRHRLDSPGGRPFHRSRSPFAGMTRIRFCGCDLSRACGTPDGAP